MIVWTYKPGSAVPYKSVDGKYTVGVNFHGFYQTTYSPKHYEIKPIGEPCITPDEARAVAEAHAAQRAESV